ncbi:hypothetical protein TRVL_04466 [Trypanosoma vivax]|uniref:Uncharacterized protein n=1 Tax=Trypanosoma vivax (strain Y486) TaxID=1055687 RepID=G0UAK7_TRYVY|nr:hypothetical protein TRVL_04466 [Trypanosoma vivax]CCC52840.1 hypothetical protein TVY486_1103240 [Trypanosoma vivax Y486]
MRSKGKWTREGPTLPLAGVTDYFTTVPPAAGGFKRLKEVCGVVAYSIHIQLMPLLASSLVTVAAIVAMRLVSLCGGRDCRADWTFGCLYLCFKEDSRGALLRMHVFTQLNY